MKNNTDYREEDMLFKKVNSILRTSGINYWVCHGTLLGIVRDSMILPWDNDIDFAVWKDEVQIEYIEQLFRNNGFQQEYIFGEMDCLHFETNTKKVDISFYEKDKTTASVKWIAPNRKFLDRIYSFIVERLYMPKIINKIKCKKSDIRLLVKCFLTNILIFVEPFLSLKFKEKLYKKIKRGFTYTGYSYPLELMNFKTISFLGESIPIPVDSEKCLELTYGLDWKIPKKNYIWYHEAKNLVNMEKDNDKIISK